MVNFPQLNFFRAPNPSAQNRPVQPESRNVSEAEREILASGLARNDTQRQIARDTGRNQSTISGERAKNSVGGVYSSAAAQQLRDTRAAERRGPLLRHFSDSVVAVEFFIRNGMPEARIPAHLATTHPHLEGITEATIRAYVNDDKNHGGDLHTFRTRGRPPRATLARLEELQLPLTPAGRPAADNPAAGANREPNAARRDGLEVDYSPVPMNFS